MVASSHHGKTPSLRDHLTHGVRQSLTRWVIPTFSTVGTATFIVEWYDLLCAFILKGWNQPQQ